MADNKTDTPPPNENPTAALATGDPASPSDAPLRDEAEIFAELASLCSAPGYVHALAALYMLNNFVTYGEILTADDLLENYSHDKLIRTELSTLFGLLVKNNIDYTFPGTDVAQTYIDRSVGLLSELHESLVRPSREQIFNAEQMSNPNFNPFESGAIIREAIFYGAESAYIFQYTDFSRKKYRADDPWMIQNKGFSIDEACDVVDAIFSMQPDRISSVIQELPSQQDRWTAFPAFTFTATELAGQTRHPPKTVEAVLDAFSMRTDEKNDAFSSLKDFNIVNATPLLKTPAGEFVSFHPASLAEALYESPFYWMLKDQQYKPVATQNRGQFTEDFCQSRLAAVFGEARVHPNVEIRDRRGNVAGEIDNLVIFGNRAIVLQAKSKRLTLEARKGNDLLLRDDFKRAVQDAYDQGLSCSKLILAGDHTLVRRKDGQVLTHGILKEIFIFCVVADHYPSLSFQARQFLQVSRQDIVLPPFVTDVFGVDVIAEMLGSPLRFLSYVNRRVTYNDRLMSSHETHLLGYHLRRNLWLPPDTDILHVGDDVAVDLDIAMAVRRTGVPGARTPTGILTRLKSTVIADLLSKIEYEEDPAAIDFGFLLLTLGEDTIMTADGHIRTINERALKDNKRHDFTMSLSEGSAGFTVHCSGLPMQVARQSLANHCMRRKYIHRAFNWFGVCLDPGDLSVRYGLSLQFEWVQDDSWDELTKMPAAEATPTTLPAAQSQRETKIGRNQPCPCGSGLKYKRCCLGER